MANREHYEIVMAGAKAIEKWWGTSFREMYPSGFDIALGIPKAPSKKERLDLSGIRLNGLELSGACLFEANFEGADLTGCKLTSCNLNGANLANIVSIQGNFFDSNLFFANLKNAGLPNSDLTGVRLYKANLQGACLGGAKLLMTQLQNADLTGANLTVAHLAETNFNKAILDGVLMDITAPEGCEMQSVCCTHFFIGKNFKECKRIPTEGFLKPGEFEDRFKSRPTIEFVFENGMMAFDPVVLGLAIDDANTKRGDLGLRLLDITTRGGFSRGIIEVAANIPKEEALVLLNTCHQQKMEQVQKEIKELRGDKKSLLQIVSDRMLVPAMETQDDEAKPLSPSREKAYWAYKMAQENGKDGSYREAWEYLFEYGPEEYDLPENPKTFADYVREAKRHYDKLPPLSPDTIDGIENLNDISNRYSKD
jgi:hypothetical protein